MKHNNTLRYVLTISLLSSVTLTGVSPVLAANPQTRELRQEMREEAKTMRDTVQANKASNSAQQKTRAKIKNGTITAISGTTLSVSSDSMAYTVTTNADTVLRRHYGGVSTLTEFAVGNKVDVRGTYTDEAKTTIAATLIRNKSIMKLRGTFIGDIVSVTGNTVVIKTLNRGNQTVTLSQATKYINRSQVAIMKDDLLVGHRIRVKGMWDKANNTVTEVTQIKDFSLPLKTNDTAASNSASPNL